MTKTTLILPEQTEPKLTFPLLANYIADDGNLLTMLLDSKNSGIVLFKNGERELHPWKQVGMADVLDNPKFTILPPGSKVVIEQL